MEIIELVERSNTDQNKKLSNCYSTFGKLISELRKKEIPSEIVDRVNRDIEGINLFSGSNRELLKLLRKVQYGILKLIEKELKLVPRNHYRNMWLAIGMAAFGIPFGVVFGISLGNMAFLGVGIPIGMAVGIGIGSAMDKKALDDDRQLDLEITN